MSIERRLVVLEIVGQGQGGEYHWTVDHDSAAGTLGVTVTGARPTGVLRLCAELVEMRDGRVVDRIDLGRVDQFANLGRRVLFGPAAAFQGVSVLEGAFSLNVYGEYHGSW